MGSPWLLLARGQWHKFAHSNTVTLPTATRTQNGTIPRESMSSAGKSAIDEGKGDLWNANWASSPYWSGTRVPILSVWAAQRRVRKLLSWLATPYMCALWSTPSSGQSGISQPTSQLQAIYLKGGLDSVIDCLILSAWCCRTRGLQVYISSHRSIFS